MGKAMVHVKELSYYGHSDGKPLATKTVEVY